MGGYPPGVSGHEDYFQKPPVAHCDGCDTDMWSQFDHETDCPVAPWNKGECPDCGRFIDMGVSHPLTEHTDDCSFSHE